MNDVNTIPPSEEVQEIMSYVPGWTVRWGISVILLTAVLLLVVAWFIRYPDVITARATISSRTPPIAVMARSGGRLHLYVDDQNVVTAGTILAIIENPASISDVFALKDNIRRFKEKTAKPAALTNIVFDRAALLGDLQKTYAEFLQQLASYQLVVMHSVSGRIDNVVAPQYGDHVSKLVHQSVVVAKETEVAERKYTSSRTLFAQGLISAVELADAESVFHEKRTTLQYVNAEIEYVKNTLLLTLELDCKRLESEIAEWEYKYVLRAPIDGSVTLYQFWSDNQFVATGNEVLTVVPRSHALLGKVYVPLLGSGKIKTGQRVYIMCDSYPFREYGAVCGAVDSISLVPRDQQYLVSVSLPNGLRTTFGVTLDFRQEMQGTARIITEDVRLLQRVFSRLRYLFRSSQDTFGTGVS